MSGAFRENMSAKRCFGSTSKLHDTGVKASCAKQNGEFKRETFTRRFLLSRRKRAVLTSTLAVTFQFSLKSIPFVHSFLPSFCFFILNPGKVFLTKYVFPPPPHTHTSMHTLAHTHRCAGAITHQIPSVCHGWMVSAAMETANRY